LIKELSGGYDADDQVRNYYDAANRLRATQHYLDISVDVDHGTFDEYEYDALGRRIVVISRRNDSMPACHPSISLCITTMCSTAATCNSSLTRYAWDGNQTLVEDRQPFGSASYGPDDGYVTYVHATETDSPLGAIDARVSGNLRVPHPTWRGMYESSSTASGAPADCSLTTNTCTLVAWNATNSLYKLDAPSDTHVTYTYTWVGGLLMNQQDATGLLYRRNRYYDPMSGRFSQEDPIGLAGGLNTYGFGAGDPVSYSDPFGLCPIDKPLCQWLKVALIAAGTDVGGVAGGGAGFLTGPAAFATVPAGAMVGMAVGATAGAALGELIDRVFFSNNQNSSSAAGGGNNRIQGNITDKIQRQMGRRGWSSQDIDETINSPFTTRSSTNLETGNSATAYYRADGSYVVRDDVTQDIIQVSDRNNPNWIPDRNIVNPYHP